MAQNDLRNDKVEDAYRPTQEEVKRANEAESQRTSPDVVPPALNRPDTPGTLSESDVVGDQRDERDRNDPDRNPDAITGAPGSHPIGTGIGAASAGAAGTAIGTMVAPGPGTVIGGAIGAVVGAVAGGYAGKGIAEAINPTDEEAYWRDEYRNRPYYDQGVEYSEYAPAYRYGWESRARYQDKRYEEVEQDLERDWQQHRGESSLDWDRAKLAARDAWHRVSQSDQRSNRDDSGQHNA